MSPSQVTPALPEAFNDVLAKMMQAVMTEDGPPLDAPCDASVEVFSQIHMKDPVDYSLRNEDTMQITKQEFEKTLTEQLDRLREDIHEIRTKSRTLKEATATTWSEVIVDLEAKQAVARERLSEIITSTGAAWERLRDGATIAWDELERAVRKARSEF